MDMPTLSRRSKRLLISWIRWIPRRPQPWALGLLRELVAAAPARDRTRMTVVGLNYWNRIGRWRATRDVAPDDYRVIAGFILPDRAQLAGLLPVTANLDPEVY